MSDGLLLAGRLRRLVATLIDAILVPALTLVLVMVTGVVEDAEDYVDNRWIVWVFLLAAVSYLLLNCYGLRRRGQTVGKQLLGIAIVPADEAFDARYGRTPLPLWKLVCVRAMFFPLLFFVVVPWLAAVPILDQLPIFLKRRRCLHDLVCGSVVVRLGGRS
jgi:uncharacterized RDD family membrane protein YckC